MTKKCLYCAKELDESCIVDFCEKCGKGVWGEKMFNAIVQNMEQANERGDLCHSNPFVKPPTDFEEFKQFD